MADLRDVLQQAAPTPPDFDAAALQRAFARRAFRRRAVLAAGAGLVAAGVAIALGISAGRHTEKHTLIVSPSSTTPSTTATSIPAVAPDVPLARVDAPALAMAGAPQRVVVTGVDGNGQAELAWLEAGNDVWHTVALHHGGRRVVLLSSGHIVYWYDEGGDRGADVDVTT